MGQTRTLSASGGNQESAKEQKQLEHCYMNVKIKYKCFQQSPDSRLPSAGEIISITANLKVKVLNIKSVTSGTAA